MNTSQSPGETEARVPKIFAGERRAIASARACRRASVDSANWLAQDMADEVLDRLDFMRFEPEHTLVAGNAGETLSKALATRGHDTRHSPSPNHERPLEGGPFNLIASCASLETVNDLPGALIHIRNALTDGGLFMGQILGAGSVPSLRQIMLAADGERPAARIHPQIDNRAATGLLERAGFARQVVDSRTLKVRFSSFKRMIGDLRDQALTSVLLSPAPYVGKAGLARARAAFDGLRREDGKVTETFEILTLTGWR